MSAMDDPDPGYGFVPFAPDARRDLRATARWDRRVDGTLAGYIDVTLVTEQPVHVGSGSRDLRERGVVQRAARVRGVPGIPGSSLRGAVRARYEAITRSCVLFAPAAGIQRVESSSGIEKVVVPHAVLARVASPCREPERDRPVRVCPACALFGCMSLRSRILFTDFASAPGTPFVVEPIPERFGPRLHHVGTYKRVGGGNVAEISELTGRKFGRGRGPATEQRQRVEAIPPGTQLRGQLRLFNVTPAELGGLFAALGCDPPSAIKIGGGKAHGFGRVVCRARCTLKSRGDAPLDPARWRQAFMAWDDRWADGEAALFALQQGAC